MGNVNKSCYVKMLHSDLGLSGSRPVLVNSASDLSLCDSEFGLYSSDLGLYSQ